MFRNRGCAVPASFARACPESSKGHARSFPSPEERLRSGWRLNYSQQKSQRRISLRLILRCEVKQRDWQSVRGSGDQSRPLELRGEFWPDGSMPGAVACALEGSRSPANAFRLTAPRTTLQSAKKNQPASERITSAIIRSTPGGEADPSQPRDGNGNEPMFSRPSESYSSGGAGGAC